MTQEHLHPLPTPVVQQVIAAAPLAKTPPHPNDTGASRSNGVSALTVADMYLSASEKPFERPRIAPIPKSAEPVYAKDWGALQPVSPQTGSGNEVGEKRHRINRVMPTLGILDALLEDDNVSDILVNGTNPIYIDVGGELTDSGLRFNSDDEIWHVAETIIQAMGQQWDSNRPMIDTRLPDGSRVNIVAPPMAADGISISIRKFPKNRITLDSMIESGHLTLEIANFLRLVVGSRLNLVISGGTGSGKTTLLNALSAAIAVTERIVTIEDSAELRLQQPHVVRLEAKSLGNQRTSVPVTIRDLVKNALRMRPDRIIVGESRGEEALDVLQAMNTGHDGSMTSLHANTPRDAVGRLEMMVTMAMPQVPLRMVRAQIANALHLIIQVNRGKDGKRRISHISEVAGMEGDAIVMQDLVVYREADKGQVAEYKWVAGSSRNAAISKAAQQAGLMRGFI